MYYDVINEVQVANPKRDLVNLPRRMIKLGEEMGEASEAYLYASTENSVKPITWIDLREEAVDTAIVAMDIALTSLPIDDGLSPAEVREKVDQMFQKKLENWRRKLSKNQDATLSQREEKDNDE